MTATPKAGERWRSPSSVIYKITSVRGQTIHGRQEIGEKRHGTITVLDFTGDWSLVGVPAGSCPECTKELDDDGDCFECSTGKYAARAVVATVKLPDRTAIEVTADPAGSALTVVVTSDLRDLAVLVNGGWWQPVAAITAPPEGTPEPMRDRILRTLRDNLMTGKWYSASSIALDVYGVENFDEVGDVMVGDVIRELRKMVEDGLVEQRGRYWPDSCEFRATIPRQPQ